MCLLSIIIPLYNQSEYILSCLDSIDGIECIDYEVIIWNDGSNDGCDLLVKEHLPNKNTHYFLMGESNHGVSYSRNSALRLARGKYVWFVDSDDLIVPNQVEPLLKYAEKYDADMVNFCWKAFDGNKFSPGIHQTTDLAEPLSGKQIFMKYRLMMAPWCYIYKRSFLMEHNLCFDETYKTCEDIQFNQKALFCANKVLTSARIAYIYRIQPESASQGKGRAKKVLKDQFRRLFDEIKFFLPKGDFMFLCRVLYLNFREICLWMKLSLR